MGMYFLLNSEFMDTDMEKMEKEPGNMIIIVCTLLNLIDLP